MRIAHCVPYAPAQEPEPDGGVALSGDRAWNPERGVLNRVADDSVAGRFTGPPPELPPSAPEARPLRAATHAWQLVAGAPEEELGHRNTGLHVEQRKGVTTPAGDLSVEPARRNTWRAPAQPWDSTLYVGVPQSGEQIGQ